MAFQISEDQRFYLAKALGEELTTGGSVTTLYVYQSMEKRGWLRHTFERPARSCWVITDMGRIVARQLRLTPEYAKDEQP